MCLVGFFCPAGGPAHSAVSSKRCGGVSTGAVGSQPVPETLSCLQMAAPEAKDSVSRMNKKSSSLLKYSIQSVLFLLQSVCR